MHGAFERSGRSRPLRVSFITGPLDLSGGAKVIMIYAGELAKRGHAVTIVSVPHPAQPLKDKVKSLVRGNGWPSPGKPFEAGPGIRHTTLDVWRPVTDVDIPDADVVIATWWRTAQWVAALSPEKGRKFYLVQHHEVFPHLPPQSRDTYGLPLKKIVVSKWLQDVMAEEYGDRETILVPNAVNRMQFWAAPREKNETPTVGLLYSTTPFKGVAASFSAISLSRNEIPSLRVVSFGSERPKRHLPLPPRSRFYYRPDQKQIRKIYEMCDVWLTCSTTEGFNLPALEAMACRTPVISTKTGWCRDGIIDGVNGYLVDAGDAEGIAKRLTGVLTMAPAKWREMSAAADMTTTAPSWTTSADLLERALVVG